MYGTGEQLDWLHDRVKILETALRRVKQELTIPAAEYVPAIPACWDIIDAALTKTEVSE